jgi:NTP pyrophosphatase (non-canonical NTP hydrolase)
MSYASYKELESEVVRWAEARKIIPNSTPVAQSRKTGEEAIELIEAAAKIALIDKLQHHLDEDVYIHERAECVKEFEDAVGDVVVTLINACALADVQLEQCLLKAYNQIKHRKGTLLPNGIFQKEQA